MSIFIASMIGINTAGVFAQVDKYLPAIPKKEISWTLPASPGSLNISSGSKLFEENKFKILALTATVALFMRNVDASIDEEYARETHPFPFSLANAFGRIGNIYDSHGTYYCIAGLSGVTVAYGFLFDDKKALKTMRLMVESYAASALISSSVKVILGRDRPYADNGPRVFHPFRFDSKASEVSFPSGHTTTIFAMMTVLAKQYPSALVKIGAYTFATSVACQRMLYRKHWGSDVIAGAAIGYWVGSYLVRKNNTRLRRPSLRPIVSVNQIGLSMSY